MIVSVTNILRVGVFVLRLNKILLISLFIFSVLITKADAFDVSAKSAILYEASSGKILYQKDINTKRPIASTTKIMTGILAIENSNQEDVVTIKKEYTGIEGTSIYLKPGEQISVKTLLHGLLLHSGNDAAVALAAHISGNADNFVTAMNLKAKIIGMDNTSFKNPNGLPDDEHYSTAYDMAKLAAYAMNNAEFKKIVSQTNYSSEGRSFVNHNKLLKMSDRIDGIKTGFTKTAGRCLVSSAEQNGMRLVAVTLSAPDDWNDHLKLYDYGFLNYSKQTFFSEKEVISKLPVVGGISGEISAVAEEELSVVISDKQNHEFVAKVYLPKFLYAPIRRNQIVGKIHLCDKNTNETVSTVNIIADNDCEQMLYEGVFERMLDSLLSIFK